MIIVITACAKQINTIDLLQEAVFPALKFIPLVRLASREYVLAAKREKDFILIRLFRPALAVLKVLISVNNAHHSLIVSLVHFPIK